MDPIASYEAAVNETEENGPRITPGAIGVTQEEHTQGAALLAGKKWKVGRTIRIAFLNGDAEYRARVRRVAEEWLLYANLKFEWVTDPALSDVRILYAAGGGSSSYLGTDNLTIPKDQPTMRFGWMEDGTILHEFGHMLALIHEHQHPRAGIPWDKPKVYAWYAGPPNNWSAATVDSNLFARYAESQTNANAYDKLSIMHYSVPNELTVGDFAVVRNSRISEGDKELMRQQYPGVGTTPPVVTPAVPPKPAPALYSYALYGWEECLPGGVIVPRAKTDANGTGSYKTLGWYERGSNGSAIYRKPVAA